MPRKIKTIFKPQETFDGAGVKLKRVFGYNEKELMDPFLLLDNFGSDNPDDYLAGFPWHPHRGIETVTYMMSGMVEHGDSLGNKGVIKEGDIQWMTAGSGIIHQEMPQYSETYLSGFQLWVNLPAKNKMIPPKYRDITSKDVKTILIGEIKIKIIAGNINGNEGPVKDIFIKPTFLDISMPKNTNLELPFKNEEKVFVYIYEGSAFFDDDSTKEIDKNNLVLYGNGEKINIKTKENSAKFILAAGNPINESIAWGGPIVMNTQEELDIAFEEYQNGNFIK